MATGTRSESLPSSDTSSPSRSDSSVASQPIESEVQLCSTRSRARRSPSRLPLRTGFRKCSGISRVIVGEAGNRNRPETEYLVHRELLTSASPFFAAALNSNFAESLHQTVRLPEEKPEIFEWFLQWLYTGTLKTTVPQITQWDHGHHIPPARSRPQKRHNNNTVPPAAQNPESPAVGLYNPLAEHDRRTDGDLRNSQGSPKYFLLLDLYSLSDRLLTTPLSNEVLNTMARLADSTNSVPTPSDTWLLYGDEAHDPRSGVTAPTPDVHHQHRQHSSSSPGRRSDNCRARALILDLFAYKKTDRLLETHRDAWHPRFLRDLCVKLKRPGPEAVARHAPSLAPWRPSEWPGARPCELCRRVLGPDPDPEKLVRRCRACGKVFCLQCLELCAVQIEGGGGEEGGPPRPVKVAFPTDTTGCKPWTGKNMCLRYHEHEEGEECEGF